MLVIPHGHYRLAGIPRTVTGQQWAALFGCSPNYSPTPTRLHEAFREPHGILGGIPFAKYEELADECSIDPLTLQALRRVTVQRMNDFTCLAWEIEPVSDFDKEDAFGKSTWPISAV